jgi:hypothetical protein
MSAERNHKTVAKKLYKSVSLVTPAVRTILIQAVSNRGDSGELETFHETWPIVAIRAAAVAIYEKTVPKDKNPVGPWTHKELVKDGWAMTHRDIEMRSLLYHPEYGTLCEVEDVACDNGVEHVIACPWAPEEDEARLSDLMARLRSKAEELVGKET